MEMNSRKILGIAEPANELSELQRRKRLGHNHFKKFYENPLIFLYFS